MTAAIALYGSSLISLGFFEVANSIAGQDDVFLAACRVYAVAACFGE
jgi:hypothetical protein